MFKVEYLLLLEQDKTKCKTVKALKSLLEADSDILVDKDIISFKGYSCPIVIKLGKNIEDNSHVFFNMLLSCDSDKSIEKFSELLKAVRGAISLISKSNYVIWDDLSLFYSQQAYPIVFNIENLMRQLITKFMLTKIGSGWVKERVPTDVQQSINPNNKDINYLNNVDFIQLSNFLFSENYPVHKDNLIQKLKSANDLSSINLDEIKSLLPESNWNRFFEPLVGCNADYLKKRWNKLYELRCNVAHNKPFNKSDLEAVNVLSSELKPYLEKALVSLDKIVIDENDRDVLAENVVINLGKSFGDFLLKYRELEHLVDTLVNDKRVNIDGKKVLNFGMSCKLLLDREVVNDEQFDTLRRLYTLRNGMVHHSDLSISAKEVEYCESLVVGLLRYFKIYLLNFGDS